ncbi:hypothetical protein DK427_09640 [Methylobacterium radiodurans]|uniref:Uncharacterized protein n=1 Tax=Methylobacterium radiodurans TaxID=2202828 RepID=A0A2U8VRA4_9HYPH|nr:hypothetical protein DK427_09640 [Methylobacterium radiodurans]
MLLGLDLPTAAHDICSAGAERVEPCPLPGLGFAGLPVAPSDRLVWILWAARSRTRIGAVAGCNLFAFGLRSRSTLVLSLGEAFALSSRCHIACLGGGLALRARDLGTVALGLCLALLHKRNLSQPLGLDAAVRCRSIDLPLRFFFLATLLLLDRKPFRVAALDQRRNHRAEARQAESHRAP